jgi:hypothetical protein
MFCDRSGYPRKSQGGAALGTLSASLRTLGLTHISGVGVKAYPIKKHDFCEPHPFAGQRE